jgi:hypothetical protein
MIYIPLHNAFRYMSVSSDREFFLSECVSWLVLNTGDRNKAWGINRDAVNGRALSIWVEEPQAACIFKLRFGL